MAYTGLEQIWDYLYIGDLVRAMYLVGERGHRDAVYPLGSGQTAPLRDYIEELHQMLAPDLPMGIGQLPYKNGRVPDSNIPDITRIREDTGFTAQVSFREGIRETILFWEKLDPAQKHAKEAKV